MWFAALGPLRVLREEDDLLGELNGARDHDRLTALLKRYRAMRR